MDKFRYIICNQPDNNIYMKQREALFRHINGLKLVEELTDVDNSKYSVMEHEKGEIVLKTRFIMARYVLSRTLILAHISNEFIE